MPIRIFQITKIKVYQAQKTFIFQFLSANTQTTKLQIIEIYLEEGTSLLKYLTLNWVNKQKIIKKITKKRYPTGSAEKNPNFTFFQDFSAKALNSNSPRASPSDGQSTPTAKTAFSYFCKLCPPRPLSSTAGQRSSGTHAQA